MVTDRVEDTVDYGEVCEQVALAAQERSYRTLERLCAAVADRLIGALRRPVAQRQGDQARAADRAARGRGLGRGAAGGLTVPRRRQRGRRPVTGFEQPIGERPDRRWELARKVEQLLDRARCGGQLGDERGLRRDGRGLGRTGRGSARARGRRRRRRVGAWASGPGCACRGTGESWASAAADRGVRSRRGVPAPPWPPAIRRRSRPAAAAGPASATTGAGPPRRRRSRRRRSTDCSTAGSEGPPATWPSELSPPKPAPAARSTAAPSSTAGARAVRPAAFAACRRQCVVNCTGPMVEPRANPSRKTSGQAAAVAGPQPDRRAGRPDSGAGAGRRRRHRRHLLRAPGLRGRAGADVLARGRVLGAVRRRRGGAGGAPGARQRGPRACAAGPAPPIATAPAGRARWLPTTRPAAASWTARWRARSGSCA